MHLDTDLQGPKLIPSVEKLLGGSIVRKHKQEVF